MSLVQIRAHEGPSAGDHGHATDGHEHRPTIHCHVQEEGTRRRGEIEGEVSQYEMILLDLLNGGNRMETGREQLVTFLSLSVLLVLQGRSGKWSWRD